MAVVHDTAQSRFETTAGGRVGVCAYRRQGDVLPVTPTEVPPELPDDGIAAAQVGAGLDGAHGEVLRVRPRCSDGAMHLRRHAGIRDRLAP